MSCESGEACAAALSANSSLTQGENFAKMTAAFHGGRRNTRRSARRFRMRGGAVELADYSKAFENLPADMHGTAGIASLDKAFADLGQFRQAGGKRSKTRRSRSSGSARQRGGVAELSASDMILTPQEEGQAFLNPQWYTENLVTPGFKGPASPFAATGGARKSRRCRKGYRKTRKTKSRKTRRCRKVTAARKCRKGYRRSAKTGKCRKSRKAAGKSRRAARKSRKAARKH